VNEMTMTESDTAQTALSAVRFEESPADSGSTRARARARAREDSAVSADRKSTTDGDRRAGVVARLMAELTPPEPWQHRPASLAAMWRYAARGGWTGPTGAARRLGVWWFRLVALPVTVVCHYAAWLVARPSRTVTAALVSLLVWLAMR